MFLLEADVSWLPFYFLHPPTAPLQCVPSVSVLKTATKQRKPWWFIYVGGSENNALSCNLFQRYNELVVLSQRQASGTRGQFENE